jgi:hypothetical protein
MSRFKLAALALAIAGGCGGNDTTAPQAIRTAVHPSADQSSAESPLVEIPYEKWVLAGGVMRGNTGNGPGTFAGQILSRVPFDNGVIVKLRASYVITDPSAAGRSFTTVIEGTLNLQRASAVLNGVVTEGWRAGAPVHVVFDMLTPCPVPSAPAGTKTCYVGIIRVGPQ